MPTNADYGAHLGREIGAALCRNLGLDPNQVVALDFHWRPDELPTVDVTVFVTEGAVRELMSLTPITLTASPNDGSETYTEEQLRSVKERARKRHHELGLDEHEVPPIDGSGTP
jgi:hypothetical protein